MILEYKRYRELQERFPRYFKLTEIEHVESKEGSQPLYSFELTDHEHQGDKPVFGLFAGVHGIEAIGVKILLSYIEYLLEQTPWNETVTNLLSRLSIAGIPIVNPSGYVANSRCNARGVDLMRNSPVESKEQTTFIGGQRFSRHLPYFRGFGALEKENEALVAFVREKLWAAPFSISLDLHSGFGVSDFVWSPYAKQRGFPPTWQQYLRIKDVLDRSLKYHVYRFEVQSETYCTSGDIWDYLYDEFLEKKNQLQGDFFLPLTLEVGSWIWIKKSPHMAFRPRNFFNPAHAHRERRVLRRHRPFLDLLADITTNYKNLFGEENRPVKNSQNKKIELNSVG